MDIIYIILEFLMVSALAVLPGIEEKRPSPKWRYLYPVPLLTALFLALGLPKAWQLMLVAVGAFLPLFGLLVRTVKAKRLISGTAALLILCSFVLCRIDPAYLKDDYLAGFEHGFSVLKEHYVLTPEKQIDWDDLYKRYRPEFQKAQRRHDSALNQKLWMQFADEFHDGHVGFSPQRESEYIRNCCELFGNDYGLSLLRLESGEFVAVNVEGNENSMSALKSVRDLEDALDYLSENAEEDRLTIMNSGIQNGTVITSWDGVSPEKLADEVDLKLISTPDLENERFYNPLYIAGKGGESVTVTFRNGDGPEEQVTLPRLGSYFPRLYSTVQKLDQGVKESNLSWKLLNEKTALFRIDSMAYDMKSYDGADYQQMTGEIREEMNALKEAGVEHIVLDLRQNSGGSPFMVMGVAQLFAPEGYQVDSYTAKIETGTATYRRGEDGKYVKDQGLGFYGEDLWAHGRVILLVNGETVSAGDEMTYLMSQYPNVTIMGYTKSNSSCQAVTQVRVGGGEMSFSAVPTLDENGDPFIDAFADRKGRVPIDVVVPVDQEMVSAVFDRGEDHLLDRALEELEK